MLRVAGARLPERLGARRSVSIAFVALATALIGLALFAEVWALWAVSRRDRRRHGVHVPVADGARPSTASTTASARPAISSFTMFFEIGTVSGGLLLGVVAELAGKRASFAAAVVVCAAGLWLLRTRVAPAPAPVPAPSPVLVPACD